MGFSVKIAPGVRIRASSHGVRAGIGPRVARVHVGTGRTGFSTGVGPVSFYTAAGHKRRRPQSGTGKRPPSAAALQRQAAAARRAQAEAEKAREARHLAVIFNEILQLHRQEFAPVERPIAPPPAPLNEQEVRLRHEKAALVGIGMFQRSERAAARQRAAISAQAELAALWQQAQAAAAQWQAYLDDQWSRLLANDPDIVLATLAEAFEDNEAPAAAIGVDGGELSLIVLIPPASAVPERMPATTQAGNLTLRKLPKGERAQLYGLLAAGHVLATVREALAVAPGIQATRVIAVRSEGQDVYGRPLLDCILAGQWTRAAFAGVRWREADAMAIMTSTASELVMNVKRGEIFPVDLTTEPEIAAVLANIDTTDLLAEQPGGSPLSEECSSICGYSRPAVRPRGMRTCDRRSKQSSWPP
jgi:hypothetical protein